MLKEEINQLLDTATEEEQQLLALTLQAIKRKRERGSVYLAGFLDLQGEFIDEQTYRYDLPITPFMMNALNIVHGGISATIADTAIGNMFTKLLPEDVTVVTCEIKMNYIAPGKGQRLIATAKVISMGRQLCVGECRLENEEGRLLAIATGTFFVVRKNKKW